jgi:hypothetical protein
VVLPPHDATIAAQAMAKAMRAGFDERAFGIVGSLPSGGEKRPFIRSLSVRRAAGKRPASHRSGRSRLKNLVTICIPSTGQSRTALAKA